MNDEITVTTESIGGPREDFQCKVVEFIPPTSTTTGVSRIRNPGKVRFVPGVLYNTHLITHIISGGISYPVNAKATINQDGTVSCFI